MRMKQPRLSCFHNILILAKNRQSRIYKMIKNLQCINAPDCIKKWHNIAKMITKSFTHPLNNLGSYLINLKLIYRRNNDTIIQNLPIISIKIPLTSHRLVFLHQYLILFAHHSIEKLHSKLLFALSINCKLLI